jgi:hypothetical protein
MADSVPGRAARKSIELNFAAFPEQYFTLLMFRSRYVATKRA